MALERLGVFVARLRIDAYNLLGEFPTFPRVRTFAFPDEVANTGNTAALHAGIHLKDTSHYTND
jgi:hypothetical protein